MQKSSVMDKMWYFDQGRI